MNKVRSAKAANIGQSDLSPGAVPLFMTGVVPPGDDLSEQGRHWQQENRAAFDCYNEWIAEHGLPLEEFSRF